jgi:NADPH:quinone reductase-like Zn-dependent oxidoreductase
MVGRVSSVGARVSFFHRGDRVAALLPYGGGNAKYVSIPKESAVLLPKSADHQDIICLVANYMPAYQCLKLAKRDGLPLTNANVLVTGGSGPVGQALVELALSEGANVYATAHKMHEEHLTKLGAKWFGIKPKKWLPYLEGKMDVVIDSLGVDGYDSTYSALNPDGILVCNTGGSTNVLNASEPGCGGCGVEESGGINKWWSSVKARYIWNRAVFYDVYESYEQNPKMFRHELQYLICKLQRGEIRPKVAGKVSLNQVPKAQSLIEAGLPNGTVICLPWKKLDPKQNVVVENLS